MNAAPHSHDVDVHTTTGYWHINYGDQRRMAPKPFRWFWESEAAYNKKCARLLRREVSETIKSHDESSRAAAFGVVGLPRLQRDQWGSEQLKEQGAAAFAPREPEPVVPKQSLTTVDISQMKAQMQAQMQAEYERRYREAMFQNRVRTG